MKKIRMRMMALLAALTLLAGAVMAQAAWYGYDDVSGTTIYNRIKDAKNKGNKVNVGVKDRFTMDTDLFAFMKNYPDVTFELEGLDFKISFKGDNMGSWTSYHYSRFIYTPKPDFSGEVEKLCGKERFQAYSVEVKYPFPSTAMFQLKSFFAPGKRVNVYTYDAENNTVAPYLENIEVGSKGRITMDMPVTGNYIVTAAGLGDTSPAEVYTEAPQLDAVIGSALEVVSTGSALPDEDNGITSQTPPPAGEKANPGMGKQLYI